MANTASNLIQPDWLDVFFAPVVRHVNGNDLATAIKDIRDAGGIILSMDVDGAKYKLTIYKRNM